MEEVAAAAVVAVVVVGADCRDRARGDRLHGGSSARRKVNVLGQPSPTATVPGSSALASVDRCADPAVVAVGVGVVTGVCAWPYCSVCVNVDIVCVSSLQLVHS